MTGILFVVLFALGVLGALLYILWSRGWMRNGYFTIGTSVLLAIAVFIIYQTVGGVLYLVVTGGNTTLSDARALLGSTALAQLLILVGGTLLMIRATDQDFET